MLISLQVVMLSFFQTKVVNSVKETFYLFLKSCEYDVLLHFLYVLKIAAVSLG